MGGWFGRTGEDNKLKLLIELQNPVFCALVTMFIESTSAETISGVKFQNIEFVSGKRLNFLSNAVHH